MYIDQPFQRYYYVSTWNFSLVLRLFEGWPLTTLLCLVSCKRVSEVHALDAKAHSYSPEGVTFDILKSTKTAIWSMSHRLSLITLVSAPWHASRNINITLPLCRTPDTPLFSFTSVILMPLLPAWPLSAGSKGSYRIRGWTPQFLGHTSPEVPRRHQSFS